MSYVETKSYPWIKILDFLPYRIGRGIKRQVWPVIMNREPEVVFLDLLVDIWKKLNVGNPDNQIDTNKFGISKSLIYCLF